MKIKLKDLTGCVEVIVAVFPGQMGGEGGHEVIDGPRNDHVVVKPDEATGKDIGKPKTYTERDIDMFFCLLVY